MKIPTPISNLIDSFQRLPGIGPKSAQRLTFHLLHFPQEDLEHFARALVALKKDTQLCIKCRNVSESENCKICSDSQRDQNTIIIVSSPLDAFAIEKTGFKGVYHVLHGLIDPLNNIGPDDLFIRDLLIRLDNLDRSYINVEEDFSSSPTSGEVELVLATNSTMEGESTAMYITKLLTSKEFTNIKIRLTRIARGLPVGGDIEYADDSTLTRALEGRVQL